jgi:hypothetical protein
MINPFSKLLLMGFAEGWVKRACKIVCGRIGIFVFYRVLKFCVSFGGDWMVFEVMVLSDVRLERGFCWLKYCLRFPC